MSDAVVRISSPSGSLRGIDNDGILRFLGIRYAEAPVGELRFRAPQPRAVGTAPIDATRFGGRNFQVGLVEILYEGLDTPGAESEDCLFLNIYAPADLSRPKPVMFWIHGGAFMSGSGNEYDPTTLVQNNDVIVVTVNYRLGIFGFLNLAPLGSAYQGSANLGIQDQIAALRWVNDNISAFGGDPGNVTIWGESAGAASVLTLLGAPGADGLFHKAMAFSGSETLSPPQDHLTMIKAFLGCETEESCLEHLMGMPARELSEFQQRIPFYSGPSLDGSVVTRPTCEAIADGGAASIPLLTGTTRDEGTLLAPLFAVTDEAAAGMLFGLGASIGRDDGAAYQQFLAHTLGSASVVDQMSRAWYDTFRASALRCARAASLQGAGGWVYNFEIETDHDLGITHFADVPFSFNWIEEGHPRIFVHPPSPENQVLAEKWSGTLVAFARSGSPNGAGLPEWPRYEPPGYSCLRLSHLPAIVSNPDGDLLSLYRVA